MRYIRQRKQQKNREDHLKQQSVTLKIVYVHPLRRPIRREYEDLDWIYFPRNESSDNVLDEYQHIRPPTSAQKVGAFITAYLDVLTWSVLWIIGIAVYMGTGYSMPAQLPLNVLTFLGAMRIPPSVRRFIHPIFPCAAFTVLGIFIFAAMKQESLDEGRPS